jgi:sortase A
MEWSNAQGRRPRRNRSLTRAPSANLWLVRASRTQPAVLPLPRAHGNDRSRLRLAGRIVGALSIAAGVLTLAWVVVVWRWQDPFTAIYTAIEQTKLSNAYDRKAARFEVRRDSPSSLASEKDRVAAEARAYGTSLEAGDPVGRIRIGRLGLKIVVVQGTDHESLKKGPGHYGPSALPGEGHLVYIAGHRTTYLAPFAYINDIRVGDVVTLQVPYGTFTYRVVRHYVVAADRLDVLRDRGGEILRLQACHPRFFASHRYLVDAKLVAVAPVGMAAYRVRAS